MKKILSVILVLMFITAGSVYAKTLSDQQQQEIIDQMLYLRGEGPRPISLGNIERAHCGTEIAADFHFNRPYFTGKYASIAETMARPSLGLYYDTPGGHFRIHYDTAGIHAVYQVNIDTVHGGPDGIPDYVNKVSDICDSVWAFEVGYLGYPPPVSDGAAGGGTDLVDIYIGNIGSDYYGYTEPEQQISGLSYTSFVVIDNDYGGIPPYNQSTSMDRRLDAARVTLAHEFFHTIHYTMDWNEFENQGTLAPQARYWWEMSAVWMEEMNYDNINDYYTYLKYFYDEPFKSLQAVTSSIDLHQYGAVVFPLFLSEKFDTVLIRDIWERCRDYGPGPNFPQAAQDAIDSFTNGASSLHDAFQEFAVWNYFTGSRAAQAPAEYGFSEAANYPMIPDSLFMTYNSYNNYDTFLAWVGDGSGWRDTLDNGDTNTLNGIPITFYEDHMPQNLAAHYLRMNNLDSASDDLFFFGILGCLNAYNAEWNFTIIKYPSDGFSLPVISLYDGNPIFDTSEVNLFSHIIGIPTPVSTDYHAYYNQRSGYGYALIITSPASLDNDEDIQKDILPKRPELVQNYPNPFNPSTIIEYSLATRTHVAIAVFDILGRRIYNLLDESKEAGPHSIEWDGTDFNGRAVASGIYFYQIKAEDFIESKKMILLR